MGTTVAPGAVVHADRHGTVVIPDDMVSVLDTAIAQLFNSDKVALDATKGKRISFAEFEAAWAAFEANRT